MTRFALSSLAKLSSTNPLEHWYRQSARPRYCMNQSLVPIFHMRTHKYRVIARSNGTIRSLRTWASDWSGVLTRANLDPLPMHARNASFFGSFERVSDDNHQSVCRVDAKEIASGFAVEAQ